uniref:Uncharacterized protein n=1 Tax=Arundo donax TaxID=35708 RepID=A0A0A9D7Z9_ARUDO
MLNVGGKMKVIVTTRNEEIANKICTVEPYRLSPLNNSMCWDIIRQNSNFESRADKQQFGQAIASKCGGVALAARAPGFMLSGMNLNQWTEVSNSNIWNEPFTENTVLTSVKLTYISMPPYLSYASPIVPYFQKVILLLKIILFTNGLLLISSSHQICFRPYSLVRSM